MAKRPAASPSRHTRSPMIHPAITDLPPMQTSSSKAPLAALESITDVSSTSSKPDKLKQSKSRNGCVTCKAKRLKCDETKPTCQQCHKRGVECGGYKKDFKWRTFEETSFIAKPAGGKTKKPTSSKSKSKDDQFPGGSPPRHGNADSNDNMPSGLLEPPYALNAPATAGLPVANYPYSNAFTLQGVYGPDPSATAAAPSHPNQLNYLSPPYSDDYGGSALGNKSRDDEAGRAGPFGTTMATFSSRSPRIIDLLSPDTDPNNRFAEGSGLQEREAVSNFQPLSNNTVDVNQGGDYKDDDDVVEEVIRQPEPEPQAWAIYLPSPAPSSPSSSSDGPHTDLVRSFYKQPTFSAGSAEMLMLRFDKQTCGILSIKDGPTENPWRNLMVPMALESPALYHAIASMTAFHTLRARPAEQMKGIAHMRKSIKLLATGIQSMRTETALATTLALAFSEGWDQPTKSGATHLRGSKILVNQALAQNDRYPSTRAEFLRLRFLVNCWIYMDVLSRLTSLDTDDSEDYDQITRFLHGPFTAETEMDPLMGCAHTLFPLIGQVANLVRRVRTSKSNSPAIVSQAILLKSRVESWKSGRSFERPEDPYTEIEHSIQTAEAYRWATLLYLHQAVPEIPSLSTAQLAERVLVALATVPLSSRATIVHFFPLLAAGCEVVRLEHRNWVTERWEAMISRMWLGNAERCQEVVQEVWRRRDMFDEAERAKGRRRASEINLPIGGSGIGKRKYGLMDDGPAREMVNTSSLIPNVVQGEKRMAVMDHHSGIPTPVQLNTHSMTESSHTAYLPEIIPFERTVRGSVHWAGVMRDWEWEVLLG